MSDWRLLNERHMLTGAGDKRASEWIANLVGVSIIRCEPQTPRPVLDPRFVLDNGQRLEVFSSSAVEPWVLHVPEIVYVASPTDG